MEAWRKGKDNPQTVSQAHSGSRETCEVKGASSGRSASVTSISLFLSRALFVMVRLHRDPGMPGAREAERG